MNPIDPRDVLARASGMVADAALSELTEARASYVKAAGERNLAEKERNAYRSALVDIARYVASPGAEDEADKLGVEDLSTLVECVRAEYGNGRVAGHRARFERCKQDIARALGLDGENPPEWGELVERVRARAAGLPPDARVCPDCHGESDEHCERCDDDGYIVPCEGCKADAQYEDSDGVPLCGECVGQLEHEAADAAKERG